MMGWIDRLWTRGERLRGHGFLARLLRNRQGNTLALVAASMIPLAGMVGGGIDISRMYITKTRLQHACDAGALAGRKSMGAGSWGTDDNTAALQYFDANFVTGSYGSNTLNRSFSQDSGTVTGRASAVLPMTLTRVIGISPTQTLAVTCTSTMQLPNTDVMFVLDTTGSMNCVAGNSSCTNNNNMPASGSKIDGLKNAVKCFYESVAQARTNGSCTGSPSGNLNPTIQVRFGFVPYASNVNVGRLLPTAYFANSWKYQSREPQWTTSTSWQQQSQTTTTSNVSYYNVAQSNCTDAAAASLNSSNDTYSSDGNTKTNVSDTYKKTGWTSASNGTCSGTKTEVTTVYTKATTKTFNQWHYGQITTDISGLKSGSSWNSSVSVPIGSQGTNQSVAWDGCIEERHTVQATSYSPVPSGANDLDVDTPPVPSDPDTLWAPALEPLIYMRNITTSYNQATTADSYTTGDYYSTPGYSCPTASQKLQTWSSVTSFDNYVDSLTAQGNTYHDIGLLWGARLMSPTGIFASENALASNGGTINRNMIFMTDGDSTSSPCDYNAYGVPWWDQRQTTDVGAASACGTNRQPLIDQINLRYAALCTVVKNKGINLYVISYGTGGTTSATEQRLTTCASPGGYYKANDPTQLQTAFQAIAAKITMLRLTS